MGQLRALAARSIEKRRLSEELNRERLLREELQAAYAELQKVERLKDAFLSRVNHELRTPLTAALLALQEFPPPNQESPLRRIFELLAGSLGRLLEIVDSLLLFSSSGAAGLTLRRGEADLRAIAADTVEKYRPLWTDKALSVALSAEGWPRTVSADPRLMEVVVKHLLLNAIHFNRKGGRIDIRAEHDEQVVRIFFADTGMGIPERELGNIFDSFYQVADYMTREVGGLGLGLAIVRRIAEAHGGGVSVKSREGEGSVFTLCLPAKPAV